MREMDAEWRARFERFGRTYAEEHEVSGWSPEGLTRRFRLFGQVVGALALAPRARTLELGCGAGTYVRYLAGQGHRVIGMDYSLPSLRRAVDADPGQAGHYLAADGYALPFAGGAFDLAVCIGVLQALSEPERLLDEIARVLRPQGLVVVEALNALEVPAVLRRLIEKLRGRPPRVRCHAPSQVVAWLERRGIRPVRRVGVYLPPPRVPRLGRLLDWPGTVRLLEGIPGAALAGSHAFWWIGRKS